MVAAEFVTECSLSVEVWVSLQVVFLWIVREVECAVCFPDTSFKLHTLTSLVISKMYSLGAGHCNYKSNLCVRSWMLSKSQAHYDYYILLGINELYTSEQRALCDKQKGPRYRAIRRARVERATPFNSAPFSCGTTCPHITSLVFPNVSCLLSLSNPHTVCMCGF